MSARKGCFVTDAERMLAVNLALVIVFWGFGSMVFITQNFYLPKPHVGIYLPIEYPAYLDPDWLDFNITNQRYTFIEYFFSYGFFILGMFRFLSIITACFRLERERRLPDFFELCDKA